MRLTGGEPSNKTGYRVNAHEIRPGVVYRDANVTVTAFLVPHGEWRSVWVSVRYRGWSEHRDFRRHGTNRCCGEGLQRVRCVDSRGLFDGGFQEAAEWQKYHARYHTSSDELAAIAIEGSAGVLVLTHQLFWGTSDRICWTR